MLLPVDFRTIDAKRDGNIVEIKWSTNSEIESDYFIVQRSNNAKDFVDVIQAIAEGTSQTIQYYNAEDYDPYDGVSYYRITQVDIHSTPFHSQNIRVDFQKEPEIAVYPNPTSGPINLHMKVNAGDEVMIMVRDVFGKDHYSTVVITSDNDEVFAIDPDQKIAPGMYVVVATSHDYVYEKKIVVQ